MTTPLRLVPGDGEPKRLALPQMIELIFGWRFDGALRDDWLMGMRPESPARKYDGIETISGIERRWNGWRISAPGIAGAIPTHNSRRRTMDIGKPLRIVRVVPNPFPMPEPSRAPAEPQPELVPVEVPR